MMNGGKIAKKKSAEKAMWRNGVSKQSVNGGKKRNNNSVSRKYQNISNQKQHINNGSRAKMKIMAKSQRMKIISSVNRQNGTWRNQATKAKWRKIKISMVIIKSILRSALHSGMASYALNGAHNAVSASLAYLRATYRVMQHLCRCLAYRMISTASLALRCASRISYNARPARSAGMCACCAHQTIASCCCARHIAYIEYYS